MAEPNVFDVRRRHGAADAVGDDATVHGDEPGGRGNQPRERPLVMQERIEAGDRELGAVGRRVRLVGRELAAVVVRAALTQQQRGAGVMHVRVVQVGQARIAEQYGHW